MVVATPFLQVDSLDQFPVSTDDFEAQLTCTLCLLGMFLVFTTVLKLVSGFLCIDSLARPGRRPASSATAHHPSLPGTALAHLLVPWRI